MTVSPASPDDRANDVFEAWLARLEAGEQEAPGVVLAAHPEIAAQLRARFDAMSLMDRALSIPEEGGPPERLGGFRIVREIARGGMGVVYEAEQEDMGRRVALKVLFPSMFPTSRAVERFQQEARAAGRLKHTNIVAVYQLGTERGLWYCAQELVDGPPLSEVIDGMRELGQAEGTEEAASFDSHASALTGMPSGSGAYWTRVAEMFAEVAEGLQTAHDHGVVHRDVKPGNLLLDPEGHLRLVDFGLARLSDQVNAMTRTGDLVGTPLYMSPEQFRGQAEGIDGRTDVYSLGATLYETLTLRPPFPGREPARLAARILSEEPASLRSLDRRIPRDLETIVQKTLEKEPDRRYATAQVLADDLRAFAHGRSIRARRIGPIPRAWRQVKRHKVRSVLSAALLLALFASGWLALGARQAATLEQSAAYDRLVRQAHEAMVRYSVSAPLVGGVGNAGTPLMPPGSARSGRSAERLFTEAIELDPTRHEAWFGRALVPAREPEARLADIDASVVRGLSSRVRSLARAHVLRALGLDSEAEAAIEAARAQPAGSPHELFFEGDLLVRQGRRDEGVVQLTRAIAGTTRTDPIHVLALLTRAQAFETEGRWAEVVVDLAAVLDAGPADPAVPVRLARAWAEVGQETEAERTLEQALVRARASFSEQDWLLMWSTCHLVGRVEWRARLSEETFDRFPNSPLVMFWRAAQVAREGRMEEAEALLDEGVGMLPTGSSLRDEALQIRAHLWFNAQRWPEAEQAHRALVERHPTDLVSRIGLAACLLNQRRIEEAAPLVEETLRIAPHEPYCHVQMAWLHSLRGEWKDGFEHARFAIELDPHSDFGHSILAGLYFDMGDFATALVEVESAIRLNPRIPGFRITQVAALNNVGRFAEALAVSEELARDEPDLKGVAHVRGYALSRLGRYSEAAQAFEQARLEDRESYQSVLELAFTRHRQGRDPEALKLILEWPVPPAEMDRRDRVFRGELLIRLGRADDALAGLLLFVDPDDSEPQGHYNLGWALFKTGRYAEAVESFDRAMACGMDTVELHSNRVRCLRLAGRGEAALPAAEALVERDPGNVDALLDLALLQREASRPLEALAAAERAWRIQPDAPNAAVLYALCLCQFDRLELALEVLQDSPTRDATTLAVLGQVLVRLQRYTAGLRLLDESLRLGAGGDNDSAVHKYRADALTMLGRYAEARDAATRGIEVLNRSWGGPYAARGDAYVRLGEVDAAIEDYRKSIELNGDAPGNLVLWKEVIRLLLEVKRDLPAASDAIEQARLQAPADRGLLYLQAHLHLRLGSLREAAAAYATLLEGDAGNPDLRTEGACALAEVGRIADAYGWLDPSATGTAWDAVLGAYLLRVLGREEEARAVARERLEAARGNESPFPAGYLAAVLAQNDEASAQLARPNGEEFGRGLVARADAYLLSGVREAAEKCLVQALAQCLSGGDLSLMPLTAALRSCDDWVAVQLWQEVLAEQTQGRLADVRALLDAHLAKEPGSEAWKKLHTAIAK